MYTEVVKIVNIGEIQSGTSKSGNPWKKLMFVGETFDQYPRKLAFLLFNDSVDKNMIMMEVGAEVEVSFVAESREFNNKYYTDLRAVSLVPKEMRTAQGNQTEVATTQPQGVAQQPQIQSANTVQNSGMMGGQYQSVMSQPSVPQPSSDIPF